MAARGGREKPTTSHRAASVQSAEANRHWKDLDEWPRSWMGEPKDLPAGQRIVACFRPFLEHLLKRDLSRKTIRKHVDNLWALGGEVIRHLNQTPSLRKRPPEKPIFDLVANDGPLPVRCPTTATRKKPYAPSNPPAEDSAASWNNSRISAATYPQIPPTSHFSQSRKNPFANQQI